MKKIVFFLVLLFSVTFSLHAENRLAFLRSLTKAVNGRPVIEQSGDVVSMKMADECYAYFAESHDTIFCIQTVCEPICSSIVKAYDKSWNFLTNIKPNIKGTFLQATFSEDLQIVWQDNTYQVEIDSTFQ